MSAVKEGSKIPQPKLPIYGIRKGGEGYRFGCVPAPPGVFVPTGGPVCLCAPVSVPAPLAVLACVFLP